MNRASKARYNVYRSVLWKIRDDALTANDHMDGHTVAFLPLDEVDEVTFCAPTLNVTRYDVQNV